MRGWRPSPCSCSTTTCQRSLPSGGGALAFGPPSPLGGGGGGAFFDSVGGGSVEVRAPEDSAPGRSRQRPDDLDPFPRWVPGAFALPLASLSKAWEAFCSPPAVRPNPSAAETPAFAPVLMVATLAAKSQRSPLSDAGETVYLRTG